MIYITKNNVMPNLILDLSSYISEQFVWDGKYSKMPDSQGSGLVHCAMIWFVFSDYV